MSRFVYRGRPKVIQQLPKKVNATNYLIDSCAFIIIASRPISNTKTLGCPLINSYFGEEVINFHLDIINSVCQYPEIVIVGGYDVKKILKHARRYEYVVIENVLYELTNSAEDLKIGLNGTRNQNVVVLDACFIPSVDSYKLLFQNMQSSSILYSNRPSDCVGCELDSSNTKLSFFAYISPKKIKGANFLCAADSSRMRKKITGSTFHNNKFDFELYDEISFLAHNDTSKSIRVDEITDDY